MSATLDNGSARRSKKREHDRRAQRALRERTKNRIAQLEAQVDALSHNELDSGGLTLIQQLATVSKQRDDLQDLLSQVEATVQKYHGRLKRPERCASIGASSLRDNRLQQQELNSNDFVDISTPRISSPTFARDSIVDSNRVEADVGSNINWYASTSNLDAYGGHVVNNSPPSRPQMLSTIHSNTAPLSSTTYSFQDLILPPSQSACDCTPHAPSPAPSSDSPNIWRMANALLRSPRPFTKASLHYEDSMSEDLAVRAVLKGWDDVEDLTIHSPFWSKLRNIDRLQFSHCPQPERLAILITMHRLLRCHAEPTAEQLAKLPAWLQQRPCQTMIPHSYATDFFVWPGLRERFVFTQHRYCSNDFWCYFTNNFRIIWPFEFRDCYNHNPKTGRLSIGAEFKACIADLRAWTMAADFFGRFPELYGDIPAFTSVPASLTDKDEIKARALPRTANLSVSDQFSPAAQIWSLGNHWNDDLDLGDVVPSEIAPESVQPSYNYL